MKKVLVAGAAGFVGTHLVQNLEKDYSVLAPSHTQMDIVNYDLIYNFLRDHQPEAIIHLAGLASTWQESPENLMRVNFEGTDNLYRAIINLKAADGFNPKILFISSSEVYGEGVKGKLITEDSPLHPLSPYATSKVKADQLSHQVSQKYKLRIAIIRPFPHSGAGQRKGFFVPDMASQIAEIEKDKTRDELMVGNLSAVRDYSHVKDVVQAYKKIMELDFTPGEVFNVCSAKPIKIKKLLEILLSFSSKKINFKKDPDRMRTGEASYRVGDNSKLIRVTGWKPKHKIEAALRDCLDYYRQIS